MTDARVLEMMRDRGVDVSDVVVGPEVDVAPTGPSHTWGIVSHRDGSTTLGGIDRGVFRPYDRYETDGLAAGALEHVKRPTQKHLLDEDGYGRLRSGAAALRQALAREPALDPSMLPVGTPLDHIGLLSGHATFVLDTPFDQRSAPPTDLNLPREVYLTRVPLGPEVLVKRIEPWFGQVGGGIVVWLARPIRWYYDTGILDVVEVR